MVETSLPDEIWLMVLQYVPLSDRLFSVQLVNKKFHSLCWDHVLCRQADFSKEIFLCKEDCLKVIKRIKFKLKTLSLHNCHWISGSICRQIPRLGALRCLDLTGFSLTWQQLHLMTSKCPLLERFALLIDLKMLNSLSTEDRNLELSLKTMYILMAEETLQHTELLDAVLVKLISSVKNPSDVSFDLYGFQREGMRFNPPGTLSRNFMETFTRNLSFAIQMLNNYPLLSLSQKYAISGKIQEPNQYNPHFIDMQFLKMSVACTDNSVVYRDSFLSVMPDLFQQLQCLIINLPSVFWTEESLGLHNLFQMKCPRLRCLNLACNSHGSADQQEPFLIEALISFISSLKKLEELNLRGIQLKPYQLTQIFSSQFCLKTLSLPLCAIFTTPENESSSSNLVPYPPNKRARISRFGHKASTSNGQCVLSKFSTLYKTITKLEISYALGYGNSNRLVPSQLLEPICKIENLEDLCLSNIMVQDFTFLKMIFKKCHALKCLTFSDLGTSSSCMYLNVLANALTNLKNIKVVRLKHATLDLSDTLFRGLRMCKDLEKLALSMSSVYYTSAALLVNLVRSLVMNCPRLHLFALWSKDISQALKDKIKRIIPKPTQQRTKLHIEFPEQGKVPPFAVYQLIDFESSIIAANYTSFNYPYSS